MLAPRSQGMTALRRNAWLLFNSIDCPRLRSTKCRSVEDEGAGLALSKDKPPHQQQLRQAWKTVIVWSIATLRRQHGVHVMNHRNQGHLLKTAVQPDAMIICHAL